MASLETLPSDQRAVLELVLRRGRSYDDIAGLLSIDRAGVRERALAAFDALGPETDVPPERRALITDYLLGQLPSQVTEDTRERLAQSPSERAWARVLASELAPLASGPLPEIPTDARARSAPDAEAQPRAARPEPAPGEAEPAPAAVPRERARRQPAGPAGRRTSRRGGAILLGVVAAVVVAIVVVLVVTGGSSKKHTSTAARASSSSTASTTPTPIAQVNLVSPDRSSKTAGVAIVLRQGTTTAIAIRAQNVPTNSRHDAYAVWLYNSPTDSVRLGFVNPPVSSNGVLQTLGQLPSNASHFSQVLVTLETTGNPRTPGKIVLEGALKGL